MGWNWGTFCQSWGRLWIRCGSRGRSPRGRIWQPVLEAWANQAGSGLGPRFTENEFWRYWFEAEKPSKKLIELAKELQQAGIKVFILSNNFRERANYYLGRALNDTARPEPSGDSSKSSAESDVYPWIHSAVTKVYFSWQTGLVKPDPKAWQLILDENNLRPEQCIYFDDQEKNVIAAKNIGIHSYLFENAEATRAIIFPS